MSQNPDKPMTDRELRERLKAIDSEVKRKPNTGRSSGLLCLLFQLFLQGCFKGCGY